MVVAYVRAGSSSTTLIEMFWTTAVWGTRIETRVAIDPASLCASEEQQPCSFAAAPQSGPMPAQHAICAGDISAAVTHVADSNKISAEIIPHAIVPLDRLSRLSMRRL